MAGAREELEEYREKVFQELRARALRIHEIDGAIASTRYLLESAEVSRALRCGDTLRALAGASRQGKLRREEARLQRQRGEAVEDLKRAEERLADVDRELEELGDSDGQPSSGHDSERED